MVIFNSYCMFSLLRGSIMINLKGVYLIYKAVGDEKFERISPKSKSPIRGVKSEILKAVTDLIQLKKVVTLKSIGAQLKYSASSIGRCIKILFSQNLIRKRTDKSISGYPVTYVWAGE